MHLSSFAAAATSTMAALAILAAAAVCVAAQSPSQSTAPIIAIVVEPFAYDPPVCVSVWDRTTTGIRNGGRRTAVPANTSSGCVWSVYVDWLEASGIRVLPLPWNAPRDRMDYILDRVNGVLFPGGILQGDATVTDPYFQTVQYIFHRAVHVYHLQDNDGFVVWGTCQGFEMLNAAAAGTFDAIQSGFVGTDPSMLNVSFVPLPQGAEDRLFHGIVPPLRAALTTKPVTLNWHSKGITPTEFQTYNATLAQWLRPISTSVDTTGRVFVSSVEGVNATIRVYATQFHPERPPFEFDNDIIAHDADTIGVSMFLSTQLRTWLAESRHAFENATEANDLLINKYPRVNHGWGVQVYFV